ncbi:MAG: PAS domain S-box protein [Deltaproteobacteria bacterium]|nr:PAS domain S-box protein [Deltaproteobacteria bacterium]
MISARQQSAKVQNEHDRLYAVFNSMDDGIYIVDPDCTVVFVNRKVLAEFGEVAGRKCYAYFHDRGEVCPGCRKDDVVGGGTGRWEWPGSKNQKTCEVAATALEGSGGEALMLMLVRDITSIKEAEGLLMESEERFRLMADHIRDVFWIKDVSRSLFLYMSPAGEALFGSTGQSICDDAHRYSAAIHPQDRERVLAAHTAAAENYDRQEFRIVKSDGVVRFVRERLFPVRDPRGRTCRVAGVTEDITEEKRLQQESEYRRQQLIQADKLASLGEVVAGVAHEINNPNSFISYNVPLLEETWQMFQPVVKTYAESHPSIGGIGFGELCQDMDGIIQAIGSGAERINAVVSDLKDFARLDESESKLPVVLNEVVEKALHIVGAQLRKAATGVDVSLAEGLPAVQGHFRKLEQVAANFMVNAAHAVADKNRGRIAIRTRYLEPHRAVMLEVEDNGRGIGADDLSRIFDPFFTTRREKGGTGLGLSVSYGLVREHGGCINVLSHPGCGTRFSVLLPLERDQELELRPTLLCVDDDVQYPNMLKSYFMRVEEMPMDISSEPRNLISYLEQHPEIDIVLCDVVMPGVNGWEVLDQVKERFPLLTVVLYSGNHEALRSGQDRRHQPDYVLEKPFEVKELMDFISTQGRQLM